MSVSADALPLARWCEGIVAAELARLARRAPSLGAGDLNIVEASLNHVVDRLVLTRAAEHPTAVARFFDIANDCTGAEGISS